ncbi:RANBP3 [Cordylochernes scorpioides]|uniref:RANBP3 n=1 Tax=Cordylochernes scorpioides TaxID=51811 RepID=A0ABY6K5F0_9ARAC|nr:RANBP3 [Cordylochernes scorpioides]
MVVIVGAESSSSVSSSAKFTLRPSLLSAQTEKLKNSTKQPADQASTSSDQPRDAVDSSTTHNGKVESSSLLSTSDNKCSSTEGAAPMFVFGQNLHERALIKETNEVPTFGSVVAPSELSTFQDAAAPKDSVDGNGLSSSKGGGGGGEAAAGEAAAPACEAESSKTLSEAAQEIQQARQQVKRKFDEVAVVTGEEEESNVLQINCKLYAVNKDTGMYQERGRGSLRLNDREVETSLTSRVVMRTQGSLRLILNTKVWAGMTVERPSTKTVRLTAIDTEGVRVFLVVATPKDAEQLFNALDWRVTTLKSQQDCTKQVSSTTPDNSSSKKLRPADPPGSSDSDFAADSSTNSASIESEN